LKNIFRIDELSSVELGKLSFNHLVELNWIGKYFP